MSRLGVTDAARTRAQNEIAPSTPAVEDAWRSRGPRPNRAAVVHQESDNRSTSAAAFELHSSRLERPIRSRKDQWSSGFSGLRGKTVPTGEAHRLP